MASTSNDVHAHEEFSSVSNPLWPAYRECFKFLKDDGKNFRVKCKLCEPREIILSTSKSSSANLKRHLERRHFYVKCDIKDSPAYSAPKKRPSECIETESIKRKRIQISTSLTYSENSPPLTQVELDKMITEFIVSGNHPLSTVEEEKFCKILNIGFPHLRVITKASVINIIMVTAEQLKDEVKNSLNDPCVHHVALSLDCCCISGRSYVGLSAHWLDRKLKRRSSAIAVRSLKGQLTYGVLAEIIMQVCHEYEIKKKIVSVVTDSASNSYKSFNVFGRTDNMDWEDDELKGNDNESIEVEPILEEENSEYVSLPPHHRCVCHSLNLIVLDDAKKAEYSTPYRNQKKTTFSKCLAFWKKERSVHAAEMIKAIIGFYPEVPNVTQWYSVYKAFENLLDIAQNKLDSFNIVCEKLDVPPFQQSDIKFLKEYSMVMQPFAKAMETLQKDEDMHMGYLLPTLTWLRRSLQAVERNDLEFCRMLVTACLNGIEMRFGDMFNDRTLIMSSVTHPKFKLRWLETKYQKESAMQMLREEFLQRSSDSSLICAGAMKKEETEFLFEQEECDPSMYDEEIGIFMSNAVKEVQFLHSLPILKDMFVTYNTSLPSSISVKRLFNPGDIQMRKESLLHDEEFESTMIFKFNIEL